MTERLPIDREALAAFCRSHGIRKLSLFGSALRDDFGPDSDVDVLIEFDEAIRPSLLTLAKIEHGLRPLFGGRRVDLGRPQDLHPALATRILQSAERQYERA
ncbi:MAG: nucleotidyltransferase domain-containing protein [Tistlia sp.]|uniref:nucleotidyltransferase family protein n=1 Tax=Tistlia sp. TaxID=3057121 RepID=UPI0034A2D9F5